MQRKLLQKNCVFTCFLIEFKMILWYFVDILLIFTTKEVCDENKLPMVNSTLRTATRLSLCEFFVDVNFAKEKLINQKCQKEVNKT